MKKILLLCFLLIGTTIALAQPKVQLIQVSVSPDNPDWLYKIGDRVKFNVVVYKNNVPLSNVEIRYELSYDMMSPFKKENVILKGGKRDRCWYDERIGFSTLYC